MSRWTAVDLIGKKRDGHSLTREEIHAFVQGSCDASWRDYQISAMLMAIYLRGLSAGETADLTLEMAASGEQFDLSDLAGVKVDKHSTGGVADTTTLIAVPLAAACGVPVFKISGRGLGFTGGTIDKLESIPGFKTGLSQIQAKQQVERIGLAILSQTDKLTPADRIFYALRDVTATVDHIPLIAASIMSKKIAAGADAIVLDVKCGSGAFMRTLKDARELAGTMVRIGQIVGRKVSALITSMDQPLGSHIGNALEVIEACEVLKGNITGDLLEISLELAGRMLLLGRIEEDPAQARKRLQKVLENGSGLEKFCRLIEAQGGNPAITEQYERFKQPRLKLELRAAEQGYVVRMKTDQIGRAFAASGGGRFSKEERIDPSAGIILLKRLHQPVEKGETIARIMADTNEKANAALELLQDAITIDDQPGKAGSVLLERIDVS